MACHPLSGAPLELIDTLRSGNAWKVRLACGYMGLPIVRRTLDIPRGDLQAPEFGHINPLRQVPVLRTREGAWLAESQAILWYLGRDTPWLPDARLAQAQVASWLSFEQTMHMHNFAQPRLQVHLRATAAADDAHIVALREAGMRAAAIMDGQLARSPYIAGDAPTIADIALYPYTSMAGEGGYDLSSLRHVASWLDRMRALPGHVPLIS
ncbi:glutathione S-transferase family protein [Bordetella petrii]|uniref:Glutathione S-transferase family protein n=1 Tax=Bordetella petrii TaxID=94624 RepID=A0ABT7W8K8_9BORD|nr:glutathione S-transferase family protein [Bordetella petrii]MDM9561516.1 glutathione S-transferase family protein [Bordetella petrii]